MTGEEFREVLLKMADAWARRDYGAAVEAFAPDVDYTDPLRYSFGSRDELRKFFENDEGYTQSTRWHTIIFDESKQTGAAEYTYKGTHRYHGLVLIKIEEGRIKQWREYQHIDPREWEEFIRATAF
jgi:hypothetical protein